jgi:hypothetical protein
MTLSLQPKLGLGFVALCWSGLVYAVDE